MILIWILRNHSLRDEVFLFFSSILMTRILDVMSSCILSSSPGKNLRILRTKTFGHAKLNSVCVGNHVAYSRNAVVPKS